MKMKTKDIIMLGVIVGIAFFFIGAMITSSFPSSEENLLPYKASSFIKLLGLGILTTTFIVGGIVGYNLNKYFKLTILIVGLVLLLVFTIAAQFMKWDMSTTEYESIWNPSGSSSEDTSAFESRPSTPGFELIFVIIAIIAIGLYKKLKSPK
jgi:hypothetical protein